MKTKTHIGNVTIVLNKRSESAVICTALVLKAPKSKADSKRKRKRVGYGLWVPPGGATEAFDKSQKHAAQRELWEETGISLPLKTFCKVGVLKGFIGSTVKPLWIVHLYLAKTFGPAMKLIPGPGLLKAEWFLVSKLPFDRMLTGDKDWIPRIIKGEKLLVQVFSTGETNAIKTWSIKKVRSFN